MTAAFAVLSISILKMDASRVSICLMQALTEALMSEHLGGAGLDVHWVVSTSFFLSAHVRMRCCRLA